MSFGFGVGDIIAVSTVARTIWGRFRDASDQFNAIQTDVFGLHRVLDDIANNLSGIQLTDKQADDLPVLIEGCRVVLHDTEELIQKNETLSTKSPGLMSMAQKALKKSKWDSATVNELRDRMISSTTFLNAFNTSLASQVSRATYDKVDVIAEDTQSLRLDQTQQKREAVLQWLSTLNFAPQQSDLSNRRQQETGSWLLGSPEYQEWVNKEGKTLVCQGMPGAGKTMLASLVIDRLQQFPGEENVGTAYIYCDYKRRGDQTPIKLTASVTKQLLQHQDSIPENILKMYQEKKTTLTFEDVLEMTGSSMARLSRVYVILDALDELGDAGQVRQTLIERLRPLQDLHQFNLMTTSRYIPSLDLNFHHPLCMDVRASPEDIRRYVEGRTSDLPKCVRESTGLQEAIATAIVDSVEGMFLLAKLHMDSLKGKTSSKRIKKALEILPKGSNALDLGYDRAMERIEKEAEGFTPLAKQLLGWLTYSERLMTVKEVQHALAIEPGTRELDEDNLDDIEEVLGFCDGLIIVDEETQIIRLVHYTTQEYFRRNGDRILACAEQDIAISCLTYLLYENFKDGWTNEVRQKEFAEGNRAEDALKRRDLEAWKEDPSLGYKRSVKARLQKYPFLEYAATYWATHARLCKQQNVRELMMSFAKDDHRVSSASQVLLGQEKRITIMHLLRGMNGTMSRSPLSAMHIIAYFGYAEMISQLLNHGFKADAKDHFRRTPLWWAASQGHHGVVELLLSQSHVNVNNRGLFTMFGYLAHTATPLGIATKAGKDETVKLLIEREDVDVNLPDRDDNSPLSSAAKEGHSTVVELLLTRRDIEVDSRNYAGQTPLFFAAAFGKADVVTQLLSHSDIDVNAKNTEGKSPLAIAVLFGRTAVVRLLCAHPNVDLDTRDNKGRDVLALVKEDVWMDQDAGHDECLEILSTAIEARSRNGPQNSEVVPS